MASIVLRELGFAYPGADNVFENLTLSLTDGWTGIVGPNGAGKSTLLGLIAGALEPKTGVVRVLHANGPVITCAQEVETCPSDVLTLAERYDGPARRLCAELALSASDVQRWESLSPGERKRWQIGGALARDPAVLLLDEPTNHLDAGARHTLLSALRRFTGVGLLVSHDRALLDELTSNTLRVARGTAELCPGNYGEAWATWSAQARGNAELRKERKQEERRLASRLDDRRRKREQAEAKKSSRRRMSNAKDHDARSAGAKARAHKAEAALARGVSSLRTRHERAGAARASTHVEKELGRSLFVHLETPPARRLWTFESKGIQLGSHRICGPMVRTVESDSRIWLRGDNGSGKTTLLDALLSAAPDDLRAWHLPQELTAGQGCMLLSTLRALTQDVRGRVLSIVAALGVDPERLLASASPSPGERRKLSMALGMGRGASCLLLDEPENHLDLPSIERLERAVADYPGALVLITHDEALGARVTSETWQLPMV